MTPYDDDSIRAVLTDLIAARARRVRPLLVGLTGSVAVGKTTLCQALVARLRPAFQVEAVSTDGFLRPNADLDREGLSLRKGFPETYDADALFHATAQLRTGLALIPGYSHIRYDVDPALSRELEGLDIVILEGLAFSPMRDGRRLTDAMDLMIYLDAEESDLEDWFLERFMASWRAAEHDPSSFYAQFRSMSATQTETFGRWVWTEINLSNLRTHIVEARDLAQIVVRKSAGHRLALVKAPQL